MTVRKKLPYREGDWFAVPLRCGGYATGVAARVDQRGGLVGYFFGPKYETIPPLEFLRTRCPEDAVLVAILGDLGFIEGKWNVIGGFQDWDRSLWPMPVFARIDDLAGKAWRVKYAESNLVQPVFEERTSPTLVPELPKDGVWGGGAIEIALTRLLSR